ncbi:alpha/beta fold hydrolase [Pseudaminobacter soli (ex Li et al. 2025)]|uniref:Alpha/beta hydrolase n=1 Tax=Pseudaminobacter soli (ex Li et al. 2025) TaxID=1295366 RepID=A0A2P7RSL7_9HYPH|nr:alpha/beta hydrolase [Mesorhizobium soli]PSJ53200.1 alpha/beta hydrolase [Mesorhizobium soli]
MNIAQKITRPSMEGFERVEYDVAGTKTVVYSIGSGDPVVFLHGGATFPGFEFARVWARDRKVIIPHHPGFGESGDDDRINSVHDYVLHYLDLFDQLKLDRFDLAGHSFGAWIAAEFAVEHSHRLRRLVLAGPTGLVINEHPTPDFFKIRAADLPEYLTADPEVARGLFPDGHDVDFLVLGYRETTSLSKVCWDKPQGNPTLGRWLHRIELPTLLVWGERDRLCPIEGASAWTRGLPDARLEVVPGTGHLVFEESPAAIDTAHRFLAA